MALKYIDTLPSADKLYYEETKGNFFANECSTKLYQPVKSFVRFYCGDTKIGMDFYINLIQAECLMEPFGMFITSIFYTEKIWLPRSYRDISNK